MSYIYDIKKEMYGILTKCLACKILWKNVLHVRYFEEMSYI